MNQQKDRLVLHPSYFADVLSLIRISQAQQITVETKDSFVKQTYRNRCYIAAANGKLALNIPIIHQKKGHSVPYSEISIDHSQNWIATHYKSIKSAYLSSPYFEFYQDDLEMLFEDVPDSLMEWNLKTLHFILLQLQLDPGVAYSETYLDDSMARIFVTAKGEAPFQIDPYIQVFQEKHGFTQPLSGLDLLFNLGPASSSYLKSQFRKISY